jgi:hypothetical protein
MNAPSSYRYRLDKSRAALLRSILILFAPLLALAAVFLFERIFITRFWHNSVSFLNFPLILILFFIGFLILEIARFRNIDNQLSAQYPQDELALERLNRQSLIRDMEQRAQAYFAQTLRFDHLHQDSNEPTASFPYDLHLLQPDQTELVLPKGSDLVEVFERQNGQLLILGELGSGKTYLLYELAKQLLARASADQHQPVPVIISLRSWQPDLSLYDWIVGELSQRFLISTKAIEELLLKLNLLPLFDGLDEIEDAEIRAACVAALQGFRSEYPHFTSQFVLTSLEDDYRSMAELAVYPALVLPALQASQVNHYLADDAFQPLRQAIAQHAMLGELLRSPFFLSLATHAYRDRTPELAADADRASLAKRILDNYIAHSYHTSRFGTAARLPTFLAWLARSLELSKQKTCFYLEQLQLDWLPSAKQSWLRRIGFGLGSGLVVALIVVLLMIVILDPILGRWPIQEPLSEGFGGGQTRYVRISFILARPLGLFTAVVVALYTTLVNPQLFERFGWFSSKRKIRVRSSTSRAIWAAFIVGLILTLVVNVFAPFWIALLSGGFFGLILGIASATSSSQIESKRSGAPKSASSDQASVSQNPIPIMRFLGFVLILLFGLLGFWFGRTLGAVTGLASGLIIFLLFRTWRSFGGFSTLVAEYRIELLQVRENAKHGLLNLASKAWRAGLATGLVYGVCLGIVFAIFGLSISLFSFSVTLSYGFALDALLNLFKTVIVFLIYGLTIGLYLGLVVGTLQSGALAILQHYLLRMSLASRALAPFRLVTWLDQASNCGLLMRIGGAYCFQHSILQQHFARLSDPNTPDQQEL